MFFHSYIDKWGVSICDFRGDFKTLTNISVRSVEFENVPYFQIIFCVWDMFSLKHGEDELDGVNGWEIIVYWEEP